MISLKKIFTTLLICVAFLLHAQEWEKVELDPEFDQSFYTKVHFIDDNNGIMISSTGLMIRTIDGGTTWNKIETGVVTNFNDISFVDENIGFVNGLKTIDGGETWIIQEATAQFKFLHAIDQDHLIANTESGGNIYQESFDGGDTWESVDLPDLPQMEFFEYIPNDYSQIDDQIGYMSVRKSVNLESSDTLTILKTVDGGDSWNLLPVPAPVPAPNFGFQGFRSAVFASEEIGLLIHSEGLLKTTDTANSFEEIIPASIPEFWFPVSVYTESKEHYLLLGLKPFVTGPTVTLYETFNGGLDWTEAISSVEYLNDATCTTNNCFAVGNGLFRKYNTSSILEAGITEVDIYPNPASTIINIEVLDVINFRVRMFNMDGKLMISESNPDQIAVDAFPKGLYILELLDINSGQKMVRKMIISK